MARRLIVFQSLKQKQGVVSDRYWRCLAAGFVLMKATFSTYHRHCGLASVVNIRSETHILL